MADKVNLANDSGSQERVALDLWDRLSGRLPEAADEKTNIQRRLEFYRECLRTIRGGTSDVTKLFT